MQQALCSLPGQSPFSQRCKTKQQGLCGTLQQALCQFESNLPTVQRLAACAITASACSSQQDRDAGIIAAGAVPVLATLLRSHQATAQHSAAVLLQKLAVEHMDTFVAAGVVPLLVGLFRSNQPYVHSAAAGELQKRTAERHHCSRLPCCCLLLCWIPASQPASCAKASSSLFVESCSWRLPESGAIVAAGALLLLSALLSVSPACRASAGSIYIGGIHSTELGRHQTLCQRSLCCWGHTSQLCKCQQQPYCKVFQLQVKHQCHCCSRRRAPAHRFDAVRGAAIQAAAASALWSVAASCQEKGLPLWQQALCPGLLVR